MASYVVTGSSRGLGFAFLQALAANPANTVIGLARDSLSLTTKLQKAGLTTVHAIEGDVGDAASLKRAAAAVSKLTNGSLDVLINNAGLVSAVSQFKTLADFDDDTATSDADFIESLKVNVLGLTHAVSAFTPLLLAPSPAGNAKKVMNLSTGLADLSLINESGVAVATPYSASKAAANVVIAKYNTLYGKGKDGKPSILFLSMSPGYVATERNAEGAAADLEAAMVLGGQFAAYAPNFTRPLTTEESISAMLDVLASKSVENGDGGDFVSHLGTKQWL